MAATLPRLRGAFALGFLFAGEEDLLIGARHGAPLAIGYGDGEMYLGSDALALAPFTDEITYLEDGDWAILHRAGAEIRDAAGTAGRSARARRSTTGAFIADKGNHRHFMAKEIHEQPEVVGRTLGPLRRTSPPGASSCPFELPFDFKDARSASRSRPAARPISPGLVAKYWFERLARLPVEIDVASEFRYREAPLEPGDAGALRLAVGRDGRHAGLAALRQGATGSTSLSVVNVPTSTMARESDVVAPTLAGHGDRRRLDQGLHLPARRAALPRDRGRPGARHARRPRTRRSSSTRSSACRA